MVLKRKISNTSTIEDLTRGNDIKALKKLLLIEENIVNMSNDETSKNTPLHTAAMKGFTGAALVLIEAGGDVRAKNWRGCTPAHLAASHGRLDVLKLLLSHDRSVLNLTDIAGNTLINLAAMKGHDNVVRYLLSEKVDLKIRNNYGNTAYHTAAQSNRLKVLKVLLRHDKSLIDDTNKSGCSPLHIATMKGYDEIIECLLSNEAAYSKRNHSGKTPFQLASEKTQKVFIKYRVYRDIVARCLSGMASLFITKRFDDDNTALHIVACFGGHPEVLRSLVNCGADVNAHNKYHQTPLYLAVLTENVTNVRTLIGLGGRVGEVEYERGRTALHIASIRHDLEILQILTRRNININVVDKDGKTPLVYAVVHKSRTGVQHLLNQNGDLSLKDQQGLNPLHFAVLTNDLDITNDLLTVADASVINEQNADGNTPLIFAARSSSRKIIDALMLKGADPHQTNNDGESAYTIGMENGFDITDTQNDEENF